MPDDVACPDPNEVVTRAILRVELQKELDKFRTEFRAELSADIARQLGAYEEKRKLERVQEHKALLEDMREVVRAMFDVSPIQRQVADHEQRLVRLEARPARRARKRPTSRKPK